MRRMTSGTALLLALVPPSQPTINMGASTASQPVRKVKSGRMGRMAAIIRIMNARSPEESLMPTTRGKSAARRQIVGTSIELANMGMLYSSIDVPTICRLAANRGDVDRAGEHGYVVQRDIDGRIARDLGEVGVDRFGGEAVVDGGDDGHGARAHGGVGFAGAQGFFDVGLGRTGQNGNAPAGFVASDAHDLAALFLIEPRELAGGAVGVQAMHAARDQPADEAAEFRLVDLPARIDGDERRREDAL